MLGYPITQVYYCIEILPHLLMKKVAHFFRWSPEFSLLISDSDFSMHGKCYKHLNQRPLCSSPSRNIRCFNSILIRAYKSLSCKLTKVKQLWNLWKCRKRTFFCKCCNSYGSAELRTHTNHYDKINEKFIKLTFISPNLLC